MFHRFYCTLNRTFAASHCSTSFTLKTLPKSKSKCRVQTSRRETGWWTLKPCCPSEDQAVRRGPTDFPIQEEVAAAPPPPGMTSLHPLPSVTPLHVFFSRRLPRFCPGARRSFFCRMKTKMRNDPMSLVDLTEGAGAMGGGGGRNRKLSFANSDR